MPLQDRVFTRRRHFPQFADLAAGVRRRLGGACQELTEAEDHVAALLGLASPPRLLLVDEETAVVLSAEDRGMIAGSATQAPGRA